MLLLQITRNLSSVLWSLVLFVIGNSFFTTLVSITLKANNFSSYVIGWVQAGYFAGLLLGALFAEAIVYRSGHIRSFAAFTAVLIVSMLSMSFWLDPVYWFMMRLIGGTSLAAMYIVIESWLLDKASPSTRGAVLSIYMTSLYLSQTFSQFFYHSIQGLPIDPYAVGAVFCALAIVPLSLTFTHAPEIHDAIRMPLPKLFNKSIFGVSSCIAGGIAQGILYSFIPVVGQLTGYDGAYLMGVMIAGGFALQYPIGKLSDIYDRRNVLIIVCMVIVVLCMLTYFLISHLSFGYFLVFLIGGFAFSLYPLGISQVCDHIEPKQLTSAIAALLIAYGVGSVFGPLAAPSIFAKWGDLALFPSISILALFLALIGIYSIYYRKAVPKEEQYEFVPLPNTSPVAASELDPRVPAEDSVVTENSDEE